MTVSSLLIALGLLGFHPQQAAPFIENLGQWTAADQYVAFDGESAVRLREDGIVIRLFEGGTNPRATGFQLQPDAPLTWAPEGDPLPGLHHFFLGPDEEFWQSGCRGFGDVHAVGVEGWRVSTQRTPSGVEVRITSDAGSLRKEFDLTLLGSSLELEGPGSARIVTPRGTLPLEVTARAESPDGAHRMLSASLSRPTPDRLRIRLPERSTEEAVVVIAGLDWSTFLGGGSSETGTEVERAPNGRIHIAGRTHSDDFPVTTGAFDESLNSFPTPDVYVAVLEPDGSELVYATYLGTSNHDEPQAMAVGADDSTYLAGWTAAGASFPTTPEAVVGPSPGFDGFVTRISEDGSSLIYSAVLWGGGTDRIFDLVLHDGGQVTVAGFTGTPTFPTTSPGFNMTPPGSNVFDLFVTTLSEDGTVIEWSFLYGGSTSEQIYGMDIDVQGRIALVGRGSDDLPLTPNAFPVLDPGDFLALFGPRGETLDYASFICWGLFGGVRLAKVAFGPGGTVVVAGNTNQTDMPTDPGSIQSLKSGLDDGFVAVIDPVAGTVLHATYLGGGDLDGIEALHLDASGVITVAGLTESPTFVTTTGAVQTTKSPFDLELFVARLSPNLDRLLYSTFLGGTDEENGDLGIDVDESGTVLIISSTRSQDFPVTQGAFSTRWGGGNHDAVVSQLSMLPAGVTKYGASTPGCLGPLAMGVTSQPLVDERFGFSCSGAPPGGTGFLLLSPRSLDLPVVVSGADIWVSLDGLVLRGGVPGGETGFTTVEAHIPSDPALIGVSVSAQFVFPDGCAEGGFAASNALTATIGG